MKNQISKEELTRISGEYQAKFGVKMDDWLTMILYELDEKMVEHKQRVDTLISKIESVAAFVRGETKSIHFANNKQALSYGFGGSLAISVGLVAIAIVGYIITINTVDYNDKQKLIKAYKNINDYNLLIRYGNVVNENGAKYLVLEKHKNTGDIRIGNEYEIDSKNKRILVPLGR